VSGERLHRRLASLRTLEWVNVGWLALVLLWWLPAQRDVPIPAGTWLRTVAYVPVAVLLVAGGWYWHRKLQQRRDGRELDDVLAVLDRVGRAIPGALLLGAVVVAVSWVGGFATSTDRWWALGLLGFAWLEHVNYFRVQLMHDTRSDLRRLVRTRRLRASWLATDLRAWQADAVSRGGPARRGSAPRRR
jgi:hypothetical protein